MQKGYETRQTEMGHDHPNAGLLRARFGLLSKTMYWLKVEASRKVDVSKYGMLHNTFSKESDALIAPDSKAPFPSFIAFGCEKQNEPRCRPCEKLACCIHDVEKVLRGSGQLSEAYLKKQEQKWHPDKWVGKFAIQDSAEELFTMMDLIREGKLLTVKVPR